jgi:hypothetical protein
MEPPPSRSEMIHHVTSIVPVTFGLLMALLFRIQKTGDAGGVTVKDVDGHV